MPKENKRSPAPLRRNPSRRPRARTSITETPIVVNTGTLGKYTKPKLETDSLATANGGHETGTGPINDKAFETELNSSLTTGIKDTYACCQLFLDLSRTRKIHEYTRITKELRRNFIREMNSARSTAKKTLSDFRNLIVAGGDLHGYMERLGSNTVPYLFVKNIMDKCQNKPSVADFDSIFTNWNIDLDESALRLISHDLPFTPEMRRILEENIAKAKECKDEKFTKKVIDLLLDVDARKQDVYPFFFVCAPSGSGKSTLAYNLGCQELPMLYMTFSDKGGRGVNQDVYKPFENISSALQQAVLNDLEALKKRRGSFHTDMVSTPGLIEVKNVESEAFETASLLVNLFTELLPRKSQLKSSWLEAECAIPAIPPGKLTIAEAAANIETLRLSFNGPFCVFLDECSVKSKDLQAIETSSPGYYIFLRSIIRLMKVVPIFSGTDAAPSNFVTLKCSSHSRTFGKDQIWAVVIMDTSSYNKSRMERRCKELLKKFRRHKNIIAVTDFLKSIRCYENPYLIDLVFDFCNQSNLEPSFEVYLQNLFGYVIDEFVNRKGCHDDFTVGQFFYLTTFKWNDDGIVVNKGRELCIHRHLAYMDAIPYEPNEPYFYLRLGNQMLRYMHPNKPENYGTLEIDARPVPFVPTSMFTPFLDAPLSGMALFGIGYTAGKYGWSKPFVSSQTELAPKLTAFDAVLEHFPIPRNDQGPLQNEIPSGQFLEMIYHASVLIASRSGGLRGAPFPMFMSHLIRELSSTRPALDDSPVGYPETLPIIEIVGEKRSILDAKLIPLIAPMAAPAWPKAAVDLLQAATNGNCRLGTFQFATGTEKVDSVVFEMNLSKVPFSAQPSEKLYANRGGKFEIRPDSIQRLAMVSECKQVRKPMTLAYLRREVVESKFELLGKFKLLETVGHTRCDLNVVMALEVEKFENTDHHGLNAVEEMNKLGYYIWYLKRVNQTYELRYVKGQTKRSLSAKDVIVIPAVEIWSRSFLDGLYEIQRS